MIEHPYQLRRIELQDFKSVASASVELRPLTVVVGANSSGKSTLLQSILAVTQAVKSGTSTPEFPLNGEFVRLGTFQETKNYLSTRPHAPMQVAFDLVDTLSRGPRLGNRAGKTRDRSLIQLTWRAHIDGPPDGPDGSQSSGFARLSSLEVEVAAISEGGEPERRLTCDLQSFGDSLGDLAPLATSSNPRGFILLQAPRIAADGRVVDWQSGESAPIHAVVLSGGLPTALLKRQSRFEMLAAVWWKTAAELLEESLEEERLRVRSLETPLRRSNVAVDLARSDIESWVEVASLSEEDELDTGNDYEIPEFFFIRRLGSVVARRRSSVVRSMVTLGEAEFRKRLYRRLSSASWANEVLLVAQSGAPGELLRECGFASERFFHSLVRYLGPLREAPHVLYDPGPSKLDLGVRGEYSAAVLHAQARSTVLMPTPDGDGEERPLSEALDFWLREFGLAQNARSEDRGRTGIGLSVTPSAIGREVDLTSVGVGVSQVLPVVLLCLLAEPGTLVVIEQPELHLHPMLQQGLADFLLACTRAGRQLVIETHSEHLVNRLRYQIARDETEETHGLIRLVFAETENGITSYREPAINAYGGLGDDWPSGFLDITARESQVLVRQSLEKRKRDELVSGA